MSLPGRYESASATLWFCCGLFDGDDCATADHQARCALARIASAVDGKVSYTLRAWNPEALSRSIDRVGATPPLMASAKDQDHRRRVLPPALPLAICGSRSAKNSANHMGPAFFAAIRYMCDRAKACLDVVMPP